MLKELVAYWRDSGIMMDAIAKLGEMITTAEYVYTHAWEACKGQAVLQKIAIPLKEKDKRVNSAEREIRKLLVEHLSLRPGQDASGCLAVMIMAKDAERIGDHGRNIFDLAVQSEGTIPHMGLFDAMEAVSVPLTAQFDLLKQAVLESDEELAHEVLDQYQGLKSSIAQMQGSLYTSDFQGREAVVSALLVRAFKRINAHIGNIASGVIFPLENIDYVGRGLKEEKKGR